MIIRERIFNDINSFVNNPKADSPLSKALSNGSLSKQEYQTLKEHYAGSDTNKKKEFDDAISATLGDKVKTLSQGFDVEPITVKFTKFDKDTIIADNDNDITNGENQTIVQKDNSPDSTVDISKKKDVLESAKNIIRTAKEGNFTEALNSINSSIKPQSEAVSNKLTEKLKEMAKNKAEALITDKQLPATNILNFDELKIANNLIDSDLLSDDLKIKLLDKIRNSQGIVTAARSSDGKFTDMSLFGNNLRVANTPYESSNPLQRGSAIPGVNIDIRSVNIAPLVSEGSGGVKIDVAEFKPFKNQPLKVDITTSFEAGKVAVGRTEQGFSTGIGLSFSLDKP